MEAGSTLSLFRKAKSTGGRWVIWSICLKKIPIEWRSDDWKQATEHCHVRGCKQANSLLTHSISFFFEVFLLTPSIWPRRNRQWSKAHRRGKKGRRIGRNCNKPTTKSGGSWRRTRGNEREAGRRWGRERERYRGMCRRMCISERAWSTVCDTSRGSRDGTRKTPATTGWESIFPEATITAQQRRQLAPWLPPATQPPALHPSPHSYSTPTHEEWGHAVCDQYLLQPSLSPPLSLNVIRRLKGLSLSPSFSCFCLSQSDFFVSV